jgi:uncharacterized protein (TIRG00374 family)
MRIRDLHRKLLWGLFLGIGVGFILALWGDFGELRRHLTAFPWQLAPSLVGLTLINYTLRFGKWQYYLRTIGVTVPRGRSLGIFLAAFPMVLTPGKVGELVKSYLLKAGTGTGMARSAPIVLAERITDGLAMFVLALAGLFGFVGQGPLLWTLLGVAGLMLLFVLFTRSRRLVTWALRIWGQLPGLGRFEPALRSAYSSTYDLFTLPRFLFAVGLGIISWGCEGLALYVTLIGLGQEPGRLVLEVAIFTLAAATLIGAVSFLPGGLGAADLSLTGLLLRLLPLRPGEAVAATLIIRFFTLWFGVAIGLVAMLIVLRRLGLDRELALKEPAEEIMEPVHESI